MIVRPSPCTSPVAAALGPVGPSSSSTYGRPVVGGRGDLLVAAAARRRKATSPDEASSCADPAPSASPTPSPARPKRGPRAKAAKNTKATPEVPQLPEPPQRQTLHVRPSCLEMALRRATAKALPYAAGGVAAGVGAGCTSVAWWMEGISLSTWAVSQRFYPDQAPAMWAVLMACTGLSVAVPALSALAVHQAHAAGKRMADTLREER